MAFVLHTAVAVMMMMMVVSSSNGTAVTGDEEQSIIGQVNQLRGTVKAANMAEVSWDSDLAQQAETWSGTCSLKTDFPDNLGAIVFMTNAPTLNVLDAINSWSDEESQFAAEGSSCYGSTCGGYSQLVWAATSRMGCGYTRCPSLVAQDDSTLPNYVVFLCLFSVAGNIQGTLPFDKSGPVCSRCPSGYGWCSPDNELCKGSCTGPSDVCICRQSCVNQGQVDSGSCRCSCPSGWYGSDCSKSCVDDKKCAPKDGTPGFQVSQCNIDYVRIKCPRMCQQCS